MSVLSTAPNLLNQISRAGLRLYTLQWDLGPLVIRQFGNNCSVPKETNPEACFKTPQIEMNDLIGSLLSA